LQSIVELKGLDDKVQTLVVNDGSTTPYDSIVDEFKSKLKFCYLEQSNQGPASARNNGAGHAEGNYIVFLDDDCTLPPDWLQEVRSTLSQAYVVGGHTINGLPDNVYSQASQVLIDYLYGYYNADPEHAKFITSNNLIIPRPIYDRLEGFDLEFTDAAAEDRDFCDRLVYYKYIIKYRPQVVIHHHHQMNLKSYWRQHFRYGYSAHLYQQKRRQRSKERQALEPLRFYINLLLFPHRTKTSRAWTISVLFVINQIANALGFWTAHYRGPARTVTSCL
jgi:GT2 family glycosyltransferase